MAQEMDAMLTGLTNSLNNYLGLGIQNRMEQEKEVRKSNLELQKGMLLNEHQSELDLAKLSKMEVVKRAMAGEIDLHTATTYAPEARAFAEGYKKQNGMYPTPDIMEGWMKGRGEDKPKKLTGAQTTVDREFGKEYAKYVAGGGYADTISQIQALEGVITDLEGGKKNLTGPIVGAGGITGVTSLPRKVLAGNSVAAQQTVEQSVQRTLKQTLGGQFTEKEGEAFMKRGYDPQLGEKENAVKLRRAVGQLKSMALAKQKAVDYYEENGTLTGFKGEFYTLKDGVIVKASKEDFYKMIGEKPSTTTTKDGDNNDPLGLGI